MLKLIYKDEPYNANETAEYYGAAQEFSTLDMYRGEVGGKYATLEKDLWTLDGSFDIMPDKPTAVYWSPVCSGADGRFAKNPEIEINLAPPVTATGITIDFDIDPCDIQVKWYIGTILLAQQSYQINDLSFICYNLVEGFDRVIITFTKTAKPYRFVKVNRVVVGQTVAFAADEIQTLSQYDEVDPISRSLPASNLSFNMADRHNRQLQFQNLQQIKVYRDDDLKGTFYVENCVRSSRWNYSLNCTDAIGVLDKDQYMGGIYKCKSAKKLATEIVGGTFEIDFTRIPEDVLITGYLPVCTKREALRQVAFVMGAYVTTFGTDKIKFLPMPVINSDSIDEDRIFYGSSVDITANVTEVQLTAHNYVKATDSREVYKNTLEDETVTVTLNEPATDFEITGGEIIDSGANYITLHGSGEVVVTGRKYVDTTSVYRQANSRTSLLEKNNIVEITDATLVHAGNVKDILKRVYNYNLNNEKLSRSIVSHGEKAGDKVVAVNPYGGLISGYITAVDHSYGNSKDFADITLIGMTIPPQTVYVHSGEVYSGEVW